MRARKWLWIGAGALCVLALAIGYLARPEDELAGAKRLHPGVAQAWDPVAGRYVRVYEFDEGVLEVLSALKGKKHFEPVSFSFSVSRPLVDHYEIKLPSGRVADLTALGPGPGRGPSCMLAIRGDSLPWWELAWYRLRSRLGSMP